MKTKLFILSGILGIFMLNSCGPSFCDCACSAKINKKYAKECDEKFKDAGSDVAQKILECDCSGYKEE